ncbi:MAG: ABC transporter permease [Candidatus Rokubacteria bacterium]|nr:ABC transporter permease [Candidatus Rokubacteria bacterium]
MAGYVVRRLLGALPILLGVSVLVFALLHLIPGDPVLAMLGNEADPRAVRALRQELGLDRPLPVQYVEWLGRVLRGNLSRSIQTREPVARLILERFPATLELAAAALLLGVSGGVVAGVVSARRRDRPADYLATSLALFGISMPNFWLGILLILVLSLYQGWLPPGGHVGLTVDPLGNLRYLVMPAIVLAVQIAGVVTRTVRSSVLEVLAHDYVRTARGKGLGERPVFYRHALKNALIPVTTVVGLQLGALLGGAVITETIFSWPGIGKFLVDAIFSRDFPIVQGIVLLVTVFFILANLAVDVAYVYLDPRVTYRE